MQGMRMKDMELTESSQSRYSDEYIMWHYEGILVYKFA